MTSFGGFFLVFGAFLQWFASWICCFSSGGAFLGDRSLSAPPAFCSGRFVEPNGQLYGPALDARAGKGKVRVGGVVMKRLFFGGERVF